MSNENLPVAAEGEQLNWWSKTKIIAQVGIDTFAEEYQKGLATSEGGRKLLDATQKTKEAVAGVYDGAVEAGSKLVDNLSGAEVAAKIEQLLAGQRRYNDILATRLAEALDRIEVLEEEVKRLSDGR